jgi:hypothetical protein
MVAPTNSAPFGSKTLDSPLPEGTSSRRSSEGTDFHIGSGSWLNPALPSLGRNQKSTDADAEAKRRKVQVSTGLCPQCHMLRVVEGV